MLDARRELPRPLCCFLLLFKIGLFTFGGGWSIVAQLQREFVDKRGWISKEDLLDIVSVGRSFPGIMVINIAVMFGYHVGGVPLGVIAAVGVAAPSVAVLSVVTVFYEQFRRNIYIARAMVGVRAAVVPIILSAAAGLRSIAIQEKVQYGIVLGGFLICLSFRSTTSSWCCSARPRGSCSGGCGDDLLAALLELPQDRLLQLRRPVDDPLHQPGDACSPLDDDGAALGHRGRSRR